MGASSSAELNFYRKEILSLQDNEKKFEQAKSTAIPWHETGHHAWLLEILDQGQLRLQFLVGSKRVDKVFTVQNLRIDPDPNFALEQYIVLRSTLAGKMLWVKGNLVFVDGISLLKILQKEPCFSAK